MKRESGITTKYATLREDLLREKNWMTEKLSRLHVFYIGLVSGIVIGAGMGVGGVYVVYRTVIFFRGF